MKDDVIEILGDVASEQANEVVKTVSTALSELLKGSAEQYFVYLYRALAQSITASDMYKKIDDDLTSEELIDIANKIADMISDAAKEIVASNSKRIRAKS